ncbi:hypothetical protein AB0H83_04600 [Dactylosporangium sp. NPDC050688]|uniref:hypothetical protein n=1 Tax=Dactylosporangium sp. NPDC050688 TaxID=3157217 RepID=UPI0033F16EDD
MNVPHGEDVATPLIVLAVLLVSVVGTLRLHRSRRAARRPAPLRPHPAARPYTEPCPPAVTFDGTLRTGAHAAPTGPAPAHAAPGDGTAVAQSPVPGGGGRRFHGHAIAPPAAFAEPPRFAPQPLHNVPPPGSVPQPPARARHRAPDPTT